MSIVDETLALLGPNGEHWIRMAPRTMEQHCMLTALSASMGRGEIVDMYSVFTAVARVIRENYPDRVSCPDWDWMGTITEFNDHPDAMFPEVVAMLEKARAEQT